jgi:hypothetical protein
MLARFMAHCASRFKAEDACKVIVVKEANPACGVTAKEILQGL